MSCSDAGDRDRPSGFGTVLGFLLVSVLLASVGTGLAAGGEIAGELKPYDPDTLQAPQLDLLEPEPEAPPPPPPPPSQATLVSGIPVPTDPARSSLMATAVGEVLQAAALAAAVLLLAWSLRHPVRRMVLLHGVRAVDRFTETIGLGTVDRRQVAKVVRAEPGLGLDEIQDRLQANRWAIRHHLAVLEVAEVVDRHRRRGGRRFYPSGWSPDPISPRVTVPSLRWAGPGWRHLPRQGRALTRSLARGTAIVLASLRRRLEALEATCRAVAEQDD